MKMKKNLGFRSTNHHISLIKNVIVRNAGAELITKPTTGLLSASRKSKYRPPSLHTEGKILKKHSNQTNQT
jgi:hypothetical protein